MSPRPSAPRITPLAPGQRDAGARDLLAGLAVGDSEQPLNIFTTLVRHPGLFRKWLPFGGKLLAGRLSVRHRELLILRTGWQCQSEYEWGQHVLIGRAAGITDDEIRRVKEGPDAQGWGELEAALLRAADELHDGGCIGDETWRALARHLDDHQLIEVPMLVGHYHMVAFTLSSLGVQREPGVPGFDI